MRITITKGDGQDHLAVTRSDGTAVATRFPHKGPIPHDFVHFAVERALQIDDAFWGMVAAGRHPEEIQDLAREAGHASASRARVPDAHFVGAIQAERIVEAFEADHWSGGAGDPQGVIDLAASGCAQSKVPLPTIDHSSVERIRRDIRDFASRWTPLDPGGSITLEWGASA